MACNWFTERLEKWRAQQESEHKRHIQNALEWARTIHSFRRKQKGFLETEDLMFKALRREIIAALNSAK